jgi:exodeoxyribonuclease VII large subunit
MSFGEMGSEAHAMSVSQLVSRMNGLLQASFPTVWVRGELSGDMGPKGAGGHRYFSLKDEEADAIVKVKLFASDFRRIPFTLEEGLLVLARGCPEIYVPRGELSLKIFELVPVGAGGIALAFAQLKARLQAEGLFDPAKKRPLPLLPRRIGVVTSRHGAALHDILKVLGARFPVAHVTIYPASVQGAAAPGEIVRALTAFSRLAESADVVILARGGGSSEDLAAFNDETVVRAVAVSRAPVISAVGHEVDITLTDLAADVRAATPSQAAEIVVERLDRFEERLAQEEKNLREILRRKNAEGRSRLLRFAPVFAAFASRVRMQGSETRAARRSLLASLKRLPALFEERISRVDGKLRGWPDRAALPLRRENLARDHRAAVDRMAKRVELAEKELSVAAGRLEALSPLRVLARGYAVVTREGETAPVTDAARVTAGDGVRVRLARGRLRARVVSTEVDHE